MMDETLRYPAAAIRWTVDAWNHDHAATVFQAIVSANGLSVVMEHDLPGKRERLRPDFIAGRAILWSEQDHMRSLVVRWKEDEAIALISQCVGAVEVSVAGNDVEGARKIIAETDKLLPRVSVMECGTGAVLPITFWHLGTEGAAEMVRDLELVRWSDIAPNYAGETRVRLAAPMEGFTPGKKMADSYSGMANGYRKDVCHSHSLGHGGKMVPVRVHGRSDAFLASARYLTEVLLYR